jgi:hypothetical protein
VIPPTLEQAGALGDWLGTVPHSARPQKETGVMSKPRNSTIYARLSQSHDDLTDWVAIGTIIFASSVLVWAPLLAGGWSL